LTEKDRLEDRSALELHRIGLVARRGCDIEFDRIEKFRPVVLWVRLRPAFPGFEVGEEAAAMIDFFGGGIERGHLIDENALALRLRADRLALLDGRKAKRKVADGRRRVRIVEKAQRNAPIGDAAIRVGLEHLLEEFPRLAIPERMLVTHGTIKAPLRNLVAGRLEMNGAKSLAGSVLREDSLRE